MRIKLNGKPYELSAPISVAELAANLNLTLSQVAVEKNREIVPRSTYGDVMVREGDEVEIVQLIGGG